MLEIFLFVTMAVWLVVLHLWVFNVVKTLATHNRIFKIGYECFDIQNKTLSAQQKIIEELSRGRHIPRKEDTE